MIMPTHEQQKKNLIEQLQSLDEGTRRSILIATAGVAMAIIVYLWLAYFNNIIVSSGQPAVPSDQPGQSIAVQTAAAGNTSIWQNMGNGMAAMYENTLGMFRGFGNILQTPRNYVIQPQ